MNDQSELDFEIRTHIRRKHTATEVAAAATALQDASANCKRVYRCLEPLWPGGLTDEELVDRLGMHSARRRRCDLKNAGLVEASGEQRTSRQGCWMTVWRIVKSEA